MSVRCHAKPSTASPAPNWAVNDTARVCWVHGGASPKVQIAQKRREFQAKALAVVTEFYEDGEYPALEDAPTELLKIASEAIAVKDQLGRFASQLQNVSHESKDGTQQIAAAVLAYTSAIDRCADILTKINRLGISDHPQKVQEDLGLRLVAAFRRTVSDPNSGSAMNCSKS